MTIWYCNGTLVSDFITSQEEESIHDLSISFRVTPVVQPKKHSRKRVIKSLHDNLSGVAILYVHFIIYVYRDGDRIRSWGTIAPI